MTSSFSPRLPTEALELLEKARAKPKPEDIHVHQYVGEVRAMGMSRYQRKILRDRIYGRFDPRELFAAVPAPAHVQAWAQEIFAKLFKVLKEGTIFFCSHPLYPQYQAMWQKLGEGWCECVSIAMTPPQDGFLPACLDNEEKSFEHHRGLMGDPREWKRIDFQILMGFWLRENTPTEIDHKLELPLQQMEAEAERQLTEWERDTLRYYFNYVHDSANEGRKQRIVLDDPKEAEALHLERNVVVERAGYKIQAKRGGRIGAELEAQVEEEAKARADAERAGSIDMSIAEYEEMKLKREAARVAKGEVKARNL